MKFPVGSKKFPHLLRREFSLQLIELVGQLSAKIGLQMVESVKFPVVSLLNREIGDWRPVRCRLHPPPGSLPLAEISRRLPK
jgi:hypothetical protein